MRVRTGFGILAIPLLAAVMAAQLPWCFRNHGSKVSRCDFYTLGECMIATVVSGGICERYTDTPARPAPRSKKRKS